MGTAGTRTCHCPTVGLGQRWEEPCTHFREGPWEALPVPSTHSSLSRCWPDPGPWGAAASSRAPSLALGCCLPPLAPSLSSEPGLPPPPAGPAGAGALHGKNHDSVAGPQGGTGCFISCWPGRYVHRGGAQASVLDPEGLGEGCSLGCRGEAHLPEDWVMDFWV